MADFITVPTEQSAGTAQVGIRPPVNQTINRDAVVRIRKGPDLPSGGGSTIWISMMDGREIMVRQTEEKFLSL